MVIPNMMAEFGAKNAYLAPDEKVFEYLAERRAKKQLSVISEYLPKQLTDGEILAIVSGIKVDCPTADFGTLIRETMKQAAGRADGSRVAALIHSK